MVSGKTKKMTEFVKRLVIPENATPLPTGIVASIFFTTIFNAMTYTMTFAFLPKLVKTFGVDEVQTGTNVGMVDTCMYIGNLLFSFVWGYLADTYGRKKISLIATTLLSLSTLTFGFSFSLEWAITSRFIQGCTAGINVTLRSLMFSICDDTNVALGVSIFSGAYSIGLILGPSVGGFLAFPNTLYPHLFGKDSVFSKFGILLPNAVLSLGLILSFGLICILVPKDDPKPMVDRTFLIEEKRQNRCQKHVLRDSSWQASPDTYLMLSIKPTVACVMDSSLYQIVEPSTTREKVSCCSRFAVRQLKDSKLGRLLRKKECVLTCCLFGLCAFISIGFDELCTLFAATSQTYGGYGFEPKDIGILMIIVAVLLLMLQFLSISKIYKCLGPKKMFQYGCLMLMMLTPTIPLLAKLINTAWFLPVLYIDMALNQFAVDITFISIHLLLGNSVEQALSGSVTGLGTAVSMVGRIAAPFGVGSLYTWSLQNKYGSSIGFPFNEYFTFFALSLVCLLSAGFTGLLPNTLNHRVREENQPLLYEESNTNSNRTYVSINTFILDSER